MNKQKGFTIIELIVVIAIIAILASIVLVNVTQYINKAKDAAIKSDMSNIAVGIGACGAALNGVFSQTVSSVQTYCDANTSYVQANLKTDIGNQGGVFTPVYQSATDSSNKAYCIYAKLNDGSYWCNDSTGITKAEASGWTACTTVSPTCP